MNNTTGMTPEANANRFQFIPGMARRAAGKGKKR